MATATSPEHVHEAPARPEIQIVPRAGLPFAAAAVVGLIVAIAGNWLWAIEFFHVVGGGAWTTLDLFLGFVLGPIIGRMSIPARIEFSARFMPKLVLLIPTLVTMTLGSGFQLAHNLGYLDSSYPRHGWIVASSSASSISPRTCRASRARYRRTCCWPERPRSSSPSWC